MKNIKKLQQKLQEAIDKEEYLEAAKIQREIDTKSSLKDLNVEEETELKKEEKGKSSGRFSVKITKEELKDKIVDLLLKHEHIHEHNEGKIKNNRNDIEELEKFFCYVGHIFRFLTPTIDKDLSKVSFDTENFTCNGFQTLDNGFTFLGCSAGGDWEHPLFFIIYFDGKKLRGYIPKEGNTWNTKYNTAYGSEQDSYRFDESDDYEPDFDSIPKQDDSKMIEDIKNQIQLR